MTFSDGIWGKCLAAKNKTVNFFFHDADITRRVLFTHLLVTKNIDMCWNPKFRCFSCFSLTKWNFPCDTDSWRFQLLISIKHAQTLQSHKVKNTHSLSADYITYAYFNKRLVNLNIFSAFSSVQTCQAPLGRPLGMHISTSNYLGN